MNDRKQPDTLAGKRIVIPDPHLSWHNGHHYNYVRSLVEAARRRGLETLVLCGTNALPQVIEEFSAKPIFRVGTYTELPTDPTTPNADLDEALVEGYQIITINMVFLSELLSLTPFITPNDIIFFHTIFDRHVFAIAQWLSSFSDEQRPQSNILFRFWLEKPRERALLQMCSPVLNMPRMRASYSADTMELCILYSNVMGRSVDLVPIPHTPPVVDPAAPRRRFRPEGVAADTLVVGFLGNASETRGFMFLREMITDVLREAPRSCHFLIQVSTIRPPEHVTREIEGLRAMDEMDVTTIIETLSADDYYALLNECDIILLSYQRERYLYVSSGVFVEAAAVGKVVVLPTGTSLEREAMRLRLGFSSFREFTAPAITASLKRAVADHAALAERSRLAADEVRRHNNADSLLSCLLDDAR
jgi:hypothetical protein